MVEEAAYTLLAACLGLALLVSALAPGWRRRRGRSARVSRGRRPASAASSAAPIAALEAPIAPPAEPDPARLHVMLGEMALRARDREKALGHFQRALELDPALGLRRTIEKLQSPPTLRRVA